VLGARDVSSGETAPFGVEARASGGDPFVAGEMVSVKSKNSMNRSHAPRACRRCESIPATIRSRTPTETAQARNEY
jgi:hypothetical protein